MKSIKFLEEEKIGIVSSGMAEKTQSDAEINGEKGESIRVDEQTSLMETVEIETGAKVVSHENFSHPVIENMNEDNVEVKEDDNDLLNKENETENLPLRKSRKRKVSESSKEGKSAVDEKETNNKNEELTDEENFDKAEKNKDDEKNYTEDMGIPAVQGFGKGKRARIPNKRYSDIALSPSVRNVKPVSENGEKEKGKDKIASSQVEKSEPSESTRINSPLPKRVKVNSIDLSNPNFLKPFKHGWKRELVWRSVGDVAGKRNGDIYYYSPEGKKLRSMREITENLKNKELSIDDFTFFKEPLGLNDPEKEIIRDAKIKSTNMNSISSRKSTTLKPKKIMSPKVMSPKVVSAKLESKSSTTEDSKTDQSEDGKLKTTKLSNSKSTNSSDGGAEEKSPKSSTLKVKITSKSKTEKKNVPANRNVVTPNEEEVSMPGKKVVTRKSAKWLQNTDSASNIAKKPCQPCSIRCPGVQGVVPTLQCRLCLCLYHNECVGMAPSVNIPNYICKNCQREQGVEYKSTDKTPPPLTPITALQSVTNLPTGLPKLQRIPKSPDIESTKSESEEIEKVEKIPDPTINEESCSILGHVTSWLPQNSRIQLDNNQQRNADVAEPARPQYVEILGGRKYLIIPKYNVVSVSPTVAAVRSIERTQFLDDANLILGETADMAASVKTEPISPSKPESSQTSDTVHQSSKVMEIEDNEISPSIKKTDLNLEYVSNTSDSSKTSSPKKKTLKLNNTSNLSNEKSNESRFMENYLQNLAYGYSTLLYVFQYLKVQDLLRSGCVCTMWRDIASHPLLWRTVRMKNSQVHSFEGLANTLQKHGTIQLDLRKMLLTNCDERWPEFSSNIGKVETLRKIELCRCPASVVENLTETNPNLEVVNAVTIRCETMNLEGLANWKHLRELRLKSTTGLTLKSDIDSLRSLVNLKTLSLTSVKDLHTMKLDVIAELSNLEILDLGECTDFPENFGRDILLNLKKLEKLRLEKGQGNCHTFEILNAVKDMTQLEQLELVNFDIKAGFDKALGACKNIKKLLIIPTYISQSATTNHMVLGGVLRLQKSLSHFVWGVTLELLRVTELFVDQCEEPEKKEKKEKKLVGNGDSIPVLKPVPLITDDKSEIPPALDPPQVEILALPGLQKLLLQSLPTTRVKILKIPFHATWRQSITDAVN